MLSKDQIEILTDKYITKLYDDLEREVISDIARRVKKMERFTETAELQAMAMREQGYSPSKIQQQVFKRLNADKDYQRQLAENTKEYKQEIKKIIEETVEAAAKAGDNLVGTAGDMAWNDDMQAWKKHSVDLKKPNGLKQLYNAIAKQTNEEMKNITQSTGFKGTTLGTTGVLNAYRRAMDMATLKMATGAFSYQTAVTDCIKALADSGLRSIDYASGRSYQLDTAARMCIRTGMNQLAGKIMQMNLEQTSTPLVYVDAHAGSRPEHAVWQGQVYAYDPEGTLKDGSKAGDKYDDFFHATDYGSVTGLMGANCAHHFYPYWEGDVIPEYTEPDPIVVDGKEYTYYEATQEMRRQERNIRKTKRNMEAMHTLGNDTTELKKKARLQEKEYLDFCKAAKINPRKYVLTVPYGASDLSKTSVYRNSIKTPSESEKPSYSKSEIQSYGFNDGTGGEMKRKRDAVIYEVDGVKIIFPKDKDETKQTMTPEMIINAYNSLPDELKQRSQKVIEIVDYYNPQDSMWRKKYKGFSHSYATGGEKITFYRYERNHNESYVNDTLRHEIGHHIDNCIMPGMNNYSETNGWKKAIKSDTINTKEGHIGINKGTRGLLMVSDYASRSSVREDFADSIKLFTLDREDFEKKYPSRARILNIILTKTDIKRF